MFNLLVVDDEWIIREGLEKTIPWTDWNINLIATAKNSKEAEKLLEMHNVHILLTDIKMPGTSGLELISEIKPQYPHLKIVILTGHSEFDFAQRAVKLGADDFLIKPTDYNELKHAMLKVTNELKVMQIEQNNVVALVTKNALYNPSEGHMNKLLSYDVLQEKFGILIIHSKEIHDIKLPNVLLIDSQNDKHIYLFHTVMNEIDWKNIINLVKEALINLKETTHVFFSLLADSPKQLLSIYKQANAASLPFYKDTHLTIYTYYDKKYGLDIEDAILYINNHYHQSMNQSELAKMFHMSNSYFSKLFKQHTGLNYVNFITSKRLNQAKILLKSTNLKTYEIAEEVGYTEPRYFSQLFKRHIGCTPMEYRGSMRNKE